ncbi:MAG: hypothetical protein AAGD14_17160 [Planctomycetota bacterium]
METSSRSGLVILYAVVLGASIVLAIVSALLERYLVTTSSALTVVAMAFLIVSQRRRQRVPKSRSPASPSPGRM